VVALNCHYVGNREAVEIRVLVRGALEFRKLRTRFVARYGFVFYLQLVFPFNLTYKRRNRGVFTLFLP
jgi:hypothetical protein